MVLVLGRLGPSCCPVALLSSQVSALQLFSTSTGIQLGSLVSDGSRQQCQQVQAASSSAAPAQPTQQRTVHTAAPWAGNRQDALMHNSLLQQHQQQQLMAARLHTAASDHNTANGTSGSDAAAAEQSKAITRLMRDATSMQQLQALISQHGRHFNAINVAAAFTRAAQLDQQEQHAPSTDPQHSPAAAGPAAPKGVRAALLRELSALLQRQQQQLCQQATPRELASVLLAVSKLGLMDQEVWSVTLSMLLQHLDAANSQDASSAAYALASTAAANNGRVPGISRQQLMDAVLTLTSRACKLVAGGSRPQAASSSSGGSSSGSRAAKQAPGGSGGSKAGGGVAGAAQAVSNLLWAMARLEVSPPLPELVLLLQCLADPRVLASADPLAVVNTLWAVSELQQLPGWTRHGEAALGVRASLAEAAAVAAGSAAGDVTQPLVVRGRGGKPRRQQELLQIIPASLLSEEQLGRLAASSSQAVSNTVLALSRFASGARPHVLDVPTAQACIQRLLHGPTAAALHKWNAQDVGNAVFAAAQVGVLSLEPAFVQAVVAAAPHWLPEAGPATVAQVALGFARLKHRHQHTTFLEALVLRGKQLLLEHKHHQHHHQHGSAGSAGSSSANPSQPSTTTEVHAQQQQSGPREQEAAHQAVQQQQYTCECLATDLSWSIAVLDETQLAREIEQLIRASGIKQESSIHTKNARRLWIVHAWLVKHKGHGLERLLTEQQLAFCAAANRHTHVLTPPPDVQAALSSGGKA